MKSEIHCINLKENKFYTAETHTLNLYNSALKFLLDVITYPFV